ncbi:EAL domain-containing protein [Streptomyces sp. NP160]|uniref:putative bifunctional diguanylate cyclase/phosphodiesterase n=1 Tax=Streptomyces sp. NP160 TaxID=2586637 RepID=UPI00111BC4BD|nr:GGDEF domain-containing phosphodiesterase [Streptomyces sp. NP160]TNM60699.1 EAL domain-containing protein [Streptomyces sp. NP160]
MSRRAAGAADLVTGVVAAACAAAALLLHAFRPVPAPMAVTAAVVLFTATVVGVLRTGDQLRRSQRLAQDLTTAAALDPLTGLPDRTVLQAALETALARAETTPEDEEDEGGSLVALLLADLDGFHEVNGRYGPVAGDALLRRTAEIVRANAPGGALVARTGGDEFAVLLTGEDAARARLVADGIAAAVTPQAPVSVGLAWADPWEEVPDVDGTDGALLDPAHEVLRRAEVALYTAKAAGGGVGLFDPGHDLAVRERALLADELRAALSESGQPDRGATAQLVVHYQQQVSTATGRIGGLEALVRWRHPRHGLVGPETFLGIVEEQGLVRRLTEHVLRTALLDARDWHTAGHRLRIAVNVSPTCLTDASFVPMVDAALRESGVEADLLVVEVTETVLMSEPQQALATARRLRALGAQLSIDDYGTGYSSLSYLADLPATELKLDRAFTMRVLTDPGIAAIVASTVDLAHRLGLRLVVEGVEDEAVLAAVVEAGCDETQGYLHGRAEPAAEVARRLGISPAPPAAPAQQQEQVPR